MISAGPDIANAVSVDHLIDQYTQQTDQAKKQKALFAELYAVRFCSLQCIASGVGLLMVSFLKPIQARSFASLQVKMAETDALRSLDQHRQKLIDSILLAEKGCQGCFKASTSPSDFLHQYSRDHPLVCFQANAAMSELENCHDCVQAELELLGAADDSFAKVSKVTWAKIQVYTWQE